MLFYASDPRGGEFWRRGEIRRGRVTGGLHRGTLWPPRTLEPQWEGCSHQTVSYYWLPRGRSVRAFIPFWESSDMFHQRVSSGYKDVVIHVSLLEVLHDGVLVDLAEQHHVVHAAVLDIVALPVVAVVSPAPLQQSTAYDC